MVTGIDAPITTVTAGTTIRAADAMANWNALNSNGVSNDGGLITTDNAGGLTAVSLHTTGGGLITYLVTPILIENNITLNSGNTVTPTCTGIGSIPSGAKAVELNVLFTPSAHGTAVVFAPHGTSWNAGLQPLIGEAANATDLVGGQATVTLDANGKIDITALNGNALNLYVGIYAYRY